jgi:pimeloyl-ACP methyl ester carboxylesterase
MRFTHRGLARRGGVIVTAGLMLATAVTVVTAGAQPADAGGLPTSQPLPGLQPQPAAASVPQPTFAANRDKHIVLINGYLTSSEGGKDVNGEWSNVIPALQGWGWQTGKDAQNRDWIGGTAIYNCDTNYSFNTEEHGKPDGSDKHDHALGGRSLADNHQGAATCNTFPLVPPFAPPIPKTTSHTTATSIEHLAYHWAWTIKDVFGTDCVKVIGHSMGGLVARYAIARAEQHDPDFPWDICVEDVVSLGVTHSGASGVPACPDYECEEQMPGSNFITWLGLHARNPQTPGGTDWTNMGSTGDATAPPPGSTNANMDPAHAVVFEEDVAHSSTKPWDHYYWKNATNDDITANIRWTDRAIGSEATTLDGPWPIRHADMSLAYNHWGCGVGNTTSAFPLANGVETVGEPYTTSFDCWYYVDVSSPQQLTVTMSSLANRDMDLFLHPGSPTAPYACASASTATTETCTVNGAASGRWYVRVRNWAGTRDPFTIQALVQNDCGTGGDAGNAFSTATAITTPKSSCAGSLATPIDGQDWYQFPVTSGQQVNASMVPSGGADFDLCVYGPSGNASGCSSNGVGVAESVSLTAAVSGNWRVQVYRQGAAPPGTYALSAAVVTPQNDCGTGSDAANSFSSAPTLTLPASGCSGQLFSGNEIDGDDYYRFAIVAGDQIDASMTPNASANYDLCLYNPSGAVVAGCTTGGTGVTEAIGHTATATGDYRLRVRLTSGTGSYTMSVSKTSPNDCGTGGDAGNAHASASPITLPVTNCSGKLTTSVDADDYFKFAVTSGQTVNASMTPNASANFDVCLYNPSGTIVAGCTAGSTGGTDTVSYLAMTAGDYRVRVKISSGTGAYTMSVSTSGLTIRRDDDERDTSSPFNLNDDVAIKRLPVVPADLSGRTTATLYVYAQAYGCSGAPPDNKYTLKANGNVVASFNPCNEWGTAGYTWKAFNVPIGSFVYGDNSFRFDYILNTGDFTTRNMNLGVDSDTDYGLSDISYDGNNVNGELMWFLVLT